MARVFPAIFVLCACGPEWPAPAPEPVGQAQEPVVYGRDSRFDVFAHPNAALRDRAIFSTVTLMDVSRVQAAPNAMSVFTSPTLQQDNNLCAGEQFAAQPTAGFCSGALISPDLVLTAGHCVTNANDCASTKFVFGYLHASASIDPITVPTADIFGCNKIVARVETDTLDFAIIKLDRAATPKFVPVPVRRGLNAMPNHARLAVIGSPSGLPVKVDSEGRVRAPRSQTLDYFEATTDTFAGSSGSAVYELQTLKLAGVLFDGEEDYVPRGNCNVVNVCRKRRSCVGESVLYAERAMVALCATSEGILSGLCP